MMEHPSWDGKGDKITNVVIEEGVTRIGDYAFSVCSSLTSVTIPASVTSIGNYAFFDCRSLTSVTIPVSVTSIGNSAFYGCSNLTIFGYAGTAAQTIYHLVLYHLNQSPEPA